MIALQRLLSSLLLVVRVPATDNSILCIFTSLRVWLILVEHALEAITTTGPFASAAEAGTELLKGLNNAKVDEVSWLGYL